MEKHTLTFVGRYTTKKDGTPLIGKNGRPYTSLRIKTNAHGDRYLSGFENANTKDWKAGDTVEIQVEEKNGYLNFETPKPEAVNAGRMTALENKITTLTLRFDKLLLMLVDKGIIEGPKKEDPNLTSAGTPIPDFTPATMKPEDVQFDSPEFTDEDFPEAFNG